MPDTSASTQEKHDSVNTRLESLASEIVEIGDSLTNCVITTEEAALFRAAREYRR